MPLSQCSKVTVHCAAIAALTMTLLVLPSRANEPRVPPGLSSGGVAVALLGPGIDYRMPEVARHLARDGEGDLIGWDFTDNDTIPFAADGPGSRWVKMLGRHAPKSVAVVVKEPPGDPRALGRLIQFALRTPAKIFVWPQASPNRPDWPILAEAVRRFPDRLFIIPAYPGNKNVAKQPAQSGSAANLIIVDHVTSQPGGQSRAADVMVTKLPANALAPAVQDAPDAAIYMAAKCAEALATDSTLTPAALKQLAVGLKWPNLARP